jgi:hypothetical protein
MEQKLDSLANHVIVIGFGPLGRLVAGRLHSAGEHVVVIVETTAWRPRPQTRLSRRPQGCRGERCGARPRGVTRAKRFGDHQDPDQALDHVDGAFPNPKIAVTGRTARAARSSSARAHHG